MNYNNDELIKVRNEIDLFINKLERYTDSDVRDEVTADKEFEIINLYKRVMEYLISHNTILLKDKYIVFTNQFFDILSQKERLLTSFGNSINEYIQRLGNESNDNTNYFIAFKTFVLLPLYWKVDDNLYSENLDLKAQLDILKSCINEESKKLLFNMYQRHYKYEKFNNFSDYSECIKDTVITIYLSGQKCTDSELDKVSMSITYAGVPGSIGYDFIGIKTIKNVFGLVNDSEFIESILSRIARKISYGGKMAVEQMYSVINSSNINSEQKKKYKFLYITAQIFDGAFKRAVLKSIPKHYDIDRDDEFEFMMDVNLPNLLSINNGEHIFTLRGYEEGLDEKRVYLDSDILFSINDKDDNQFIIQWGEDTNRFSYENQYDVQKYLEEKLSDVFNHVTSDGSGKIKLIYFWLEKYKVLENVGLKFSDKYKIEYVNEQWMISENPDELESVLYNNCDEKISMINAIVGKNGSGKTTMLDALKYHFNNQSDEKVFGKFFIIYEDGENLILRHNFNKGSLKFEAKCSKRFRMMSLDAKADIFANTSILSYTSFTDFTNYFGSEHNSEAEGNHRDLSINNDNKILERVKDATDKEGIKRQLVNADNYRKLALLSESKAINDALTETIPLPHEVLLKIEFKNNSSECKNTEKTYVSEVRKELEGFFDGRLVEKIDNSLLRNEKVLENVINFDLIYRIKIKDPNDFVYIYKFVRKELPGCNMICTVDFLGLSSGQYAKLTLFARLFFESGHTKVKGIEHALALSNAYIRDYSYRGLLAEFMSCTKNENLMILLDEGDMFFHPEWQKGFISDVKVLLNHAFKDHNVVKTIHLLVTSNSPFIMSDIPIEHTIVLGKEGCMEQTYAQNIHDILKSSFFMHTGTLGVVAQKHIRELVGLLGKVDITEKDRLYIKKSINMIGEPLIRYKLESMYRKRFSEEISKDERIKQLEEELARLKGQEV